MIRIFIRFYYFYWEQIKLFMIMQVSKWLWWIGLEPRLFVFRTK